MKTKPTSVIIGAVIVVIIAIVGVLYMLTKGPDQTPSQVVQAWIHVYPGDLKKAAPMTTKAMRQGLSLDDWVKTSQETLGEFRYIKGEVTREKVNGDKAEVLVDTEISSTLGNQLQQEQFRLALIDSEWVIEERGVVMVLPSPPPFL